MYSSYILSSNQDIYSCLPTHFPTPFRPSPPPPPISPHLTQTSLTNNTPNKKISQPTISIKPNQTQSNITGDTSLAFRKQQSIIGEKCITMIDGLAPGILNVNIQFNIQSTLPLMAILSFSIEYCDNPKLQNLLNLRTESQPIIL